MSFILPLTGPDCERSLGASLQLHRAVRVSIVCRHDATPGFGRRMGGLGQILDPSGKAAFFKKIPRLYLSGKFSFVVTITAYTSIDMLLIAR
jgi:hypothetical protein